MDGSVAGDSPNLVLEHEVAALYEEHAARLLSYAQTLVRNPDAGRDAVQEVFLRYFAERRYGNCVENPRAWLFRVLRNYVMDQLKSAASRHEISAEGTPEQADRDACAETIIERRQTAREIVSRLTPRELDCLRLRAEGFSYTEIAHRLGVAVGTVNALLPRVYAKLRQGAAEGALVPTGTEGALDLLLHGGTATAS